MAVARNSIFQPIANNSTLKDRTVEMLTEAILSGKISPGEKLNESQLARDLHVSRAPVREAMQQLQEQGLIVNIPRRGMFAVSLDEEAIGKINSLRVVLEGEALRLARLHLNPQRKNKLEQLLITMENMGPSSAKLSMPIDFEFHRTIWSYSGNEYLEKILTSLTAPVFAHSVRARLAGARPVALLPHRPLVEFICGRSQDSAEQIMLAHIPSYHQPEKLAGTSEVTVSPSVSLET
jgi:DNA-binding GntR family transcriptional regulator